MITGFQILYHWMLCIGKIIPVISGYFWRALGLFLVGGWNFYLLKILDLHDVCLPPSPSNF